jgi:ABC-type phosphate/phosphonate transport system ATPase subunit
VSVPEARAALRGEDPDARGCRALPVDVRDLRVDLPGHGARALDGVTLRILAGEQVALLGPSGAGKTTLVRALLGAVRPMAGAVSVGGVDPTGSRADLRAVRRRIGLVRQGGDLVPSLSARANALAGVSHELGPAAWLALARGRVPVTHATRLAALADEHGLGPLLDVPTGRLSGGQRQRVALLRALMGRPGLLLADEPTAGLDPGTASSALAALRGAPGTLLVATHDLAVARAFGRVVALRAGRVVHDGDGFDAGDAEALYGVRA